MTESTFTFVTDRAGGTYLHQCHAQSLSEAILSYIEQENARSCIPLDVDEDGLNLVQIQGMRAVWCGSCLDQGEMHALVHIIRTQIEPHDTVGE